MLSLIRYSRDVLYSIVQYEVKYRYQLETNKVFQ